MKTAIYPGSFDPITLGHLNIIKRAAACFDRLIVCVMINSKKQGMFPPEERVELLKKATARFPNVEVDYSEGLLAAYAKRRRAHVVVKGLRAVYDWKPKDPSEPEIGYCLYVNTSDPEAGYVSQSGNGIYELGDKVTVIASPTKDYDFIGWYDEAGMCLSTDISYTLTISKRTTTIEARFKKREAPVDEVEIVPGPNPDDPSSTEKGGEVEVIGEAIPGQTVEIIAMPKPGYAFEGWYLDGVFIPEAEMSHEILIGKDMGKLEAKFRELPVDLEVEGGENGWAEVTRYRGDVINLKAEPIVDHTFMGWYLLDQLLSKALNYDFDVNILRAALPAIRAVYTKGTVANETIVREELVTIAFSGNQLCVTARQAIRRLMVYSFEGDLLGTNGQMEQGDIYRLSIRSPLLLVIEATDGTRIVCKLSSGR